MNPARKYLEAATKFREECNGAGFEFFMDLVRDRIDEMSDMRGLSGGDTHTLGEVYCFREGMLEAYEYVLRMKQQIIDRAEDIRKKMDPQDPFPEEDEVETPNYQ